MALIIEPVYADGIAQLSYLIGDDSEGVAAVIDPRPDCDIYLKLAKEKGLKIEAIYETHIHADFMSGSLALQETLGRDVPVRVSCEGDAGYDFEHEKIQDGSEATFGALRMVARHTPGHTPEHLSYLVYQGAHDKPFAVFTGDTLFVDSVGRPDLLGEDETDELAQQLFDSIHGFYSSLDGGVMVYPGHGAGSACGPDIGDRMFSTIGYEKSNNPYFAASDKEEFIEKVLAAAPEEPRHYRPMKKLNASARTSRVRQTNPAAMSPDELVKWIQDDKSTLLDTRSMLAFAGAHIPGSLNIEAQGELSVWSGWLLDFDAPIVLLLEKDSDLQTVQALLWRTGHHNVVGYLAGGMMSWIMEGKPLSSIQTPSISQLRNQIDETQILDVRSESERQSGYIPSSKHVFLPDIEKTAKTIIDPNKKVTTYCASGFRASIAASILKRNGFSKVGVAPGSWVAWNRADFPVEKPEEELEPA
ncbi:rhodanese-like domain-containing protein [Pelagicoccus enzymogenes]|uniref:MBL fold metallo-hydrolase n=1 Tax=Pelagicoccus enzymogenes TaxID=2773457 RepID=UPI00280C8D63|nr:rhodanese-like domain-containing protein [Pelagicoccus enzymogenes]MDQ8198207.1 rhodanese-like domain-containing protein [Pelagicoccus enzymogenes]